MKAIKKMAITKVLSCLAIIAILMSAMPISIVGRETLDKLDNIVENKSLETNDMLAPTTSVPAKNISAGHNTDNELINNHVYIRPELPEGKPHTDKLVHLIEPKAGVFTASLSETKILIVTSGHGPLTGISPEEEKDYWKGLLEEMGYTSVDWYDGLPTFDLLNPYDLVIYDAGGYWYPLSNEVEPLWDYHFAGKPLIIVAPDINYDWGNIEESSKPTFCEDVMHTEGALGILPEVGFDIITNTGHEIIVSVPTNVEIPVASQSSWPDCFDPASDCDGVLTQGYIEETEFGVGSCSDLPSYAPYDPKGNLFSVVAYSGSESEGRTALYGFPPTAIEESNILDLLAEGTINWALAKGKPADIELTLYIEDATTPEDAPAIVNKAPGDLVEIIAVVENKETSPQTVNVELSVPPELGYPEGMVIIREDFSPQSKIRDNLPVLSVPLLDLEPGTIQVVWRFRISDSASPQSTNVQAEAKVGGSSCAADTGGFRIVDHVDAIIVTNRYLLYDNYDEEEVGSLLRYLFQISEGGNTISKKNCIVYYVDHYDAELEDWDQVVDYGSENKANEVANDIDDLIEDWAEKLVERKYLHIWPISILLSETYPYMMIVGGDEVIPFYRTSVLSGTFDEKDMQTRKNPDGTLEYPDYTSTTPLFRAIGNNYYLTDSVYADVKKDDWGTGNVELATGRITGDSAKNMQNFIGNGLTGPHGSKNMIIVADGRNKGKNIAKDGKKAGFNILNDDESPNTIETENWKDTDLMTAMKKGFKLLWHASHGDYNELICDSCYPPGGCKTDLDTNEVLDSSKVGNIKDKNPFISTAGCHSGLLGNKDTTNTASDNLVWAFVDQGVSGYLGSSSVVYCTPGGKLGVDFYRRVFRKESVGSAFKETLVNFDPITNHAKRTVRQFILYGVPWMPVELPGVTIQSSTQTLSTQSYNISAGAALDAYTATVDVVITDCTFESKESFEVPVLNGDFDDMIYISNTYEPVVPYIKKQMMFPLECEITDVAVSLSSEESLGLHNIPSALNDPMGSELYTDITTASGIYPSWIKYYETNTLEGNTILNIYVTPLKYDISTHEVVLFKQVEIIITYQTPITAAITDFSPTKTEYTSGEPISTSVTIENVGSDALTGLQADLSLIDLYGQVKASSLSAPFDVTAGESKTISVELDQSLPHGSYLAELNVINSTGDILGSSSEYIYISTGGITDFFLPSEVESGEDITFNITFENSNTTSVEATGVVYIYDPHDIEIAKLPSLPITVAPDTEELISITWSTVGKEIGGYKAAAYVFANGEAFGPEYRTFEIKPKYELIFEITSDKKEYSPGGSVTITTKITNEGEKVVLITNPITTTFIAEDGSVVLEEDLSYSISLTLGKGGQWSFSNSYRLPDDAKEGFYDVKVSLSGGAYVNVTKDVFHVKTGICKVQITSDPSLQDRPSIVYANGYYYVAYQSWETSYPGLEHGRDIFIKKFDSNWNELAKVQVTSNRQYQDSPSLIFANNKLYVAYVSNEEGANANDYDVILKEYDLNLNYIGGSKRYLTTLPSCQDMPSLLYKDGYFYLAYQSWETGSSYHGDIYIKKFDSNWNQVKKVRVTSETSYQDRPSLIYANSYFYVAYFSMETGNYDIFVKRLDANLNSDSWKKQITSESSSQSYPSLKFVNNEYAIAYASNEGGTLGIFMKKYDSNWNFIEKTEVIDDNSANERRPAMTYAQNNYWIAYVHNLIGSDDWNIFAIIPGCEDGPSPTPTPTPTLKLLWEITVDKAEYSPGDYVHLTQQFTNEGEETVLIANPITTTFIASDGSIVLKEDLSSSISVTLGKGGQWSFGTSYKLPDNAPEGYYDVRVSISGGNYVKITEDLFYVGYPI